MTGRVHSFETFGAADGPGVRFVIFVQGCNFRCRYCHNPDTWAGGKWTEITAEDALRRALRYRPYWGEQGGITVSGGEPLLQPEFVAELFERAHAAGVNTCLDTAAGPFQRDNPAILRALAATDTVLLDLKHIDPDSHRALTGADNAAPLDCARYLSEIGKPTWIRHVLVPGVTTDPAALQRLGNFIATLSNIKRVEVLPYHSLGEEKWRMLGLDYTLADTPPPTPEQVQEAQRRLGACHP